MAKKKVLVCAYAYMRGREGRGERAREGAGEREREREIRVCEDFLWISLQENLIQVLSVMILPPQGVKQA